MAFWQAFRPGERYWRFVRQDYLGDWGCVPFTNPLCAVNWSLLGNSGLGAASVLVFCKHKARVFLAARTSSKGEAAIAEIKKAVPDASITFLQVDLASFHSIKSAAETFTASSNRLDVLLNNAGIMGVPPSRTEDGYEIQIATNYMGHALLTRLLLPILEHTAGLQGSDVRIINLTSEGHIMAPKGGIALKDDETSMAQYSTWSRYGQSKLANILHTRELARRYPNIRSITVHPGTVDTALTSSYQAEHSWWAPAAYKLLRTLVLKTPERGVLTQLWAATAGEAKTGTYYVPVARESKGSGYSRDEKLAEELWNWTQKQFEARSY